MAFMALLYFALDGSLWRALARDYGSIEPTVQYSPVVYSGNSEYQTYHGSIEELPEVPEVVRKNRMYGGSTKLSEEQNDDIKALQSKMKKLQQKLEQKYGGSFREELRKYKKQRGSTGSSEEVTSPPPTFSSVDLKNEPMLEEKRTKVEIKFSNGIQRGIWIPKPPNQVTMNDVQKYLMKTPERLGILAGKMAMFSVKINENNYDDIHEEDHENNLPLFDGKIVLECWLI